MKNIIKTIIVDDESNAINILSGLLKEFEEIDICSTAKGVDEVIPKILDHKPDLLFLDVQMPGKDGFELLHELKQFDVDPKIIFVTAYDEYAINALRYEAFDYLLKPVDFNELKKAIHRFKFNQDKPKSTNEKSSGKIRFDFRATSIFLDPVEILYILAEGNYSEIFCLNEKTHMVSMYLVDVHKRLPQNKFKRISRSTIINMKYLTSIDRKKRICYLSDDDQKIELKITRQYLQALNQS